MAAKFAEEATLSDAPFPAANRFARTALSEEPCFDQLELDGLPNFRK